MRPAENNRAAEPLNQLSKNEIRETYGLPIPSSRADENATAEDSARPSTHTEQLQPGPDFLTHDDVRGIARLRIGQALRMLAGLPLENVDRPFGDSTQEAGNNAHGGCGLTPTPEPGLTVSFRLNEPGSTARVALVANEDGNLFVGVKALEGLGEDESSALAELITHLSAVTRLACDLKVSSPGGHRSLPNRLDDDRDRRLDEDSSVAVEADQLARASLDDPLKSRDGVRIDLDRLAGVDDVPSDNGAIAHESSPSADVVGAHSVGEEPVAEDSDGSSAADTTARLSSLLRTWEMFGTGGEDNAIQELRKIVDWVRPADE